MDRSTRRQVSMSIVIFYQYGLGCHSRVFAVFFEPRWWNKDTCFVEMPPSAALRLSSLARSSNQHKETVTHMISWFYRETRITKICIRGQIGMSKSEIRKEGP